MGELGDYIAKKRKELKISMRELASRIGKSAAYICDIEKGYRNPNEKTLLDAIAAVFNLTGKELEDFYDLAARNKGNASPQDIAAFVTEDRPARVALRRIKNMKVSEAEWQHFLKQLEEKRKNNGKA